MTRLGTQNRAIGKALLVAGSMSLSLLLTSCGGGGGGGGGSTGPPPPVTNATLSSVNPIVATAGSPGFTLTANGAGFTQSSQVTFNGSVKTTAFVSASKLTAAISSSDIAQASPAAGYPVTVQTGSSVTSAVHFFVVPPVGPQGVSVSAGSTTQAATIQVVSPPGNPSTPLSLTDVGVGSMAGVTGGKVKQGTSATLLLVGNGIVPGTFYVVTGGQGDVTVTQPVATDFATCSSSGGGTSSTPCVNLSVSVSATAATGPRNIIVTNPAGELAAFVGGLLITQ